MKSSAHTTQLTPEHRPSFAPPPPPPKIVSASEQLSSLAQSLKSRFDAAVASAWNYRSIEAFAIAIADVDAAIALLAALATDEEAPDAPCDDAGMGDDNVADDAKVLAAEAAKGLAADHAPSAESVNEISFYRLGLSQQTPYRGAQL
jgi:hypothetical protein